MLSGLEQVQHADKLVPQKMFVDADEERTTVQPRQQELLRNLTSAAKLLLPPPHMSPDGRVLEKLAADAIKLKHALMLSPKDYRIHYCLPNIMFDPTWMQAHNEESLEIEDRKAAGKNIALCLFPAPLAQDAMLFTDDASTKEALVKNNSFFPTCGELRAFNPKQCIAKAVVLVL